MATAATAGGEPLARVSALTKRYPGATALDALTLDIPHGVVGLVGPNGAGKSTLIKILLGLVEPTSGTAETFGLDTTTDGLRIRERVGYMPEHDCLPGDMSATKLVVHMARMSGLPATAARERAAETLRHVGLFEERYRHMGGYSTGMKQRAKLAQALVHDPRLLFLDEPTNGLDPKGRDDMLALVARTGSDFGISVVMSSHLLGEIESVCDSLVVIEHGRLVRAGAVSDFTTAADVLTVEVDRDPDRLVAGLAERGVAATVDGRAISVPLPAGTEADDCSLNRVVVAIVAELGLPLVRVGRRRHTLGELFDDRGRAA
jgi:ABC-2 type transport system ATP-binding protein